MSTKRIILANGSRLLREVFRNAINNEENLRVVKELSNPGELPSAIERFDPEWVILSSLDQDSACGALDRYLDDFPSVGFILLSLESKRITMNWQTSTEEELTNLSVREFIHILNRDLQPI